MGNIVAAREYFGHLKFRKEGNADKSLSQPNVIDWYMQNESDFYIPTIDWSKTGLIEERSQYEITVKIFYLSNTGPSYRSKDTVDAIHMVLRMLNVRDIDLVIASFPKLKLNQHDEKGEHVKGSDSNMEDDEIKTWIALENLNVEKTVHKLGLEDFACDRLARFLTRVNIRPKVNQIHINNCHDVDPSLLNLAKTEGIELLTHNDSTNILPCLSLRDLCNGCESDNILSELNKLVDSIDTELSPLWVTKYTAVVKDRGVIENQGYFAVLANSEEPR